MDAALKILYFHIHHWTVLIGGVRAQRITHFSNEACHEFVAEDDFIKVAARRACVSTIHENNLREINASLMRFCVHTYVE